jgi:CheY-like chemotaxis protein
LLPAKLWLKTNLRPYAIAISGHGMKADREMSAEAGFCHHLVKPIFPEKLDALLQEATTELKKKD